MTKLDLFRAFLTKQGFRPQIHDDYVAFKHEAGTYVLPLDDADPNYFRIVFPNFWSFQTPSERQRVLETAAVVTGMIKAVKVFPGPNDTIASVEMLLPDEDAFRTFFPRALLMLQAAVREFCTAMHGTDDDSMVAAAIKKLFGKDGERRAEAG